MKLTTGAFEEHTLNPSHLSFYHWVQAASLPIDSGEPGMKVNLSDGMCVQSKHTKPKIIAILEQQNFIFKKNIFGHLNAFAATVS